MYSVDENGNKRKVQNEPYKPPQFNAREGYNDDKSKKDKKMKMIYIILALVAVAIIVGVVIWYSMKGSGSASQKFGFRFY